eukprot:SM000018S03683  [mRNA]  locus=s18:747846:750841:- [translate_table: standard]
MPATLCADGVRLLGLGAAELASAGGHGGASSACGGRLLMRRAALGGAALGSAAAATIVLTIGGGALAVAAAMAAPSDRRQQAAQATRRGMELFRKGDIAASLAEFDCVLELDLAQRPYLWQRGLSLYYAARFEEGAAQFRDDVAVNPNDTEEAIWAYLCEAQSKSPKEAQEKILQVGQDPRPVMRIAYELFKGGGSTDELLKAAGNNTEGHDAFYAKLYAGLYHESQGNAAAARACITDAVHTSYAQRSGDYMASLARVHCSCRGWPITSSVEVLVVKVEGDAVRMGALALGLRLQLLKLK